MKVSVQIRPNPEDRRPMSGMADYARRAEAGGFPGIWVGNSMGRGRPTLDPLAILASLAAVTERVELGIAVLQVSLRHPIELAHRVMSVQALSGNRLRLGVGSGSTRADFELLGGDYDQRFRTLRNSLATCIGPGAASRSMAATLVGVAGMRGRAADPDRRLAQPALDHLCRQGCQGWTPSGRYSSLEDLEGGMRVYREAGGDNAVLANVAIDLAKRPESAELANVAHTSLICPPDEARQRLKRIEQMGFDEVLLVSHLGVLEDIERARDFL